MRDEYDEYDDGEAHGGHEEPHHGSLEAHLDAPAPRRRSRARGCLPVLLVLVVLAGAAWFGGRFVYDALSSHFGPAPDYAGPGSGTVLYEVKKGDTSADIGRELKSKGVVKSVDAFNDAARANEKSRSIQVGYYQLKKQMKASQALDVLVNPDNLIQSLVVVPEGARVRQVVKTIVDKTDIPKRAVTAALANPRAIGLPAQANGNPEGYLFPATYTVPPKQTAVGLLRQMVGKSAQVDESLDLATKARSVGLTPEQVLTVASILEYEANHSEDYPKVARVLYNRLHKGMPLQLDSTVAYVSQRSGDVWTTAAERANNSAYNTYVHAGLPPGPIGSPGEETIKAALAPASGSWLYFVPDYQHHTTHFSTTYAEHQKWVAKLKAYCAKSADC